MLSKLRSRLSYANVMATIAVFIALGGTSYAVATGSIGSREIKNNSVRSKDLRNNTIRGKDIRTGTIRSSDVGNGSLLAEDFKAGQLPAGPQGPKGDPGALSGVETVEASSNDNSNSPKEVTAICPAGKRVIGTGAATEGGFGAPIAVATVRAFGTNAADVVAFETAATPDTWHVTAQAICAKVS